MARKLLPRKKKRAATSDATTASLFVYRILVLSSIPVLFFLVRIAHDVGVYHRLQKSEQEFENSIASSSLWMPSSKTIRGDEGGEGRQDKNNDRLIGAKSSPSSTSTIATTKQQHRTEKKDYSDPTKYWRYDEAAPPVQYAKTHQLQSLPTDYYRLGQSAFDNITEYLLQPQNRYPSKLHIFEINPSITILPPKYRVPYYLFERNNNDANNENNIPMYLASYRVTDQHNCASPTKPLMFGNGSWEEARDNVIGKVDFLGLALLKDDLTILADVVVNMTHESLMLREFHFLDFRLYTLHDELYLSTHVSIGKLKLRGGGGGSTWPNEEESSKSKDNKDAFVHLQHVDTTNYFSVFFSTNFTCPPLRSKHEYGAKNLLYFVDNNGDIMTQFLPNSTSAFDNDVRAYKDFPVGCLRHVSKRWAKEKEKEKQNYKNKASISSTSTTTLPPPPTYPLVPSFHNYHEERYPESLEFLLNDRNSACCVRMKDPWAKQDFLVGVIHPKTPYPGKYLPEGVRSNIYMSRFFAMETVPPYAIVARTGAFCFGYPENEDEITSTANNKNGNNFVWHFQEDPMVMSGDTFDCPRIHFVMSIIDNATDDSQVIISYGVNDCNSRFITVNKVDIQAMLWPRVHHQQ